MEAITGRVRELIEGSNFCFIGTIRKDGTAHVHPVWIGIEGDTLIVNTAEGRIWPRNVRREPRVTLTVPDSRNPYEYVEIRGRVVDETRDGAVASIHELARKYIGQDYPLAPDEQRILFRVQPDTVVHRVMG